ncbi:MAG: biotin--[acetyl-CoA-carboxylase] ligase [Betaproteobacteria bacterium]
MTLSPVAFALLRRLSDGELHSGETLASAVGMTRARVSQLLSEAENAGLSLERVRGRGYRLVDATPFLDADAVLHAIGARAPGVSIEIVDSVDSTNAELLRRAAHADIHRHLLVAEWQHSGRGRRGREWTAIAGGSLTFTLGWRFEQPVGFLSALPLAVGVAIVRALDAAGVPGVGLKWPNDLVHDGAKVGGILIELAGDALGPSVVAVGVGINVRFPPAARGAIAQPVTDLASIAGAPDRNHLLAELAVELSAALERYARDGFAAFRAEWRRRDALHDRFVEVRLPDGSSAHGIVAGVDERGALLVDRDGRRQRFISGEVSVRGAIR